MEPITRSEQYLASILGEDVVLPIPQSRIEYYLNAIAQNGIAPSSAGLINYDPDANYPDGSIGKEMHTLDGDVSQLKSQMNPTAEQIANLKNNWQSDKNYVGLFRQYPFPDAAFAQLGVKVYSDKKSFFTDYEPNAHKNTGGSTYYYSPVGNNSNAGTKDSPKQYMTRPLTDGDTHIFMDGIYTRGSIPEINKSVNVVAEHPGKAIFKNSDNYTYTLSDGVYSTARSNVVSVIVKINGMYMPLDVANSLANCKAAPLSFFSDSSTVYINAAGLFVPNDSNTFLNLGTGTPLFSIAADAEDISTYFEGLIFIGGHLGGVVAQNTSDYTFENHFNNCDFVGSYTTQSAANDNYSALGGKSYFYKCSASYARKDGFNYHAANSEAPLAVEIDCIAHDNGHNGWDNSNNGSTSHEGACVMRVNCVYYNNKGTNVADANNDTKTMMLSCLAFNSLSSDTAYSADYSTQQSGATAWLDGCKGYGSDWTIYAVTGTTMHLHECEKETTNGGGTIDAEWNPYSA